MPRGGIGGEDGGTRAHLCRGQPLLPDETDQHLGGLLQGDGAGGTEGPPGTPLATPVWSHQPTPGA